METSVTMYLPPPPPSEAEKTKGWGVKKILLVVSSSIVAFTLVTVG